MEEKERLAPPLLLAVGPPTSLLALLSCGSTKTTSHWHPSLLKEKARAPSERRSKNEKRERPVGIDERGGGGGGRRRALFDSIAPAPLLLSARALLARRPSKARAKPHRRQSLRSEALREGRARRFRPPLVEPEERNRRRLDRSLDLDLLFPPLTLHSLLKNTHQNKKNSSPPSLSLSLTHTHSRSSLPSPSSTSSVS